MEVLTEIIFRIQQKDEAKRPSSPSRSDHSSQSSISSKSRHSTSSAMHQKHHNHRSTSSYSSKPIAAHTNPNKPITYQSHYNVTTSTSSKQQKVDQILNKSRISPSPSPLHNKQHDIKEDEYKQTMEESPKTMPQKEFERYLGKLKLNNYHEKFEEKGCDSMLYLELLDEKTLKEEIGMSAIHCKLLQRQITNFKQAKEEFVAWLNKCNLNMYQDTLEQHGVFTFESFHRLIRDKETLINIIDNEYDGDLMWSSTPREKRRCSHQSAPQQQMEGLRIN